MCDYKSKYIKEDYKCPHPDYGPGKDENEVFCIFHGDREDKDVDKFYEEFKKLYKSGKHDFRGFIFPESFDFRRLKDETGPLEFINVSFSGACFLCDLDLSEAKFKGGIGTDFSFSKFLGKGRTSFGRAQFTGNIVTYFHWAEFLGDGGTNFSNAKFSSEKGVHFNHAKFSDNGDTFFNITQFYGNGIIDFKYAEFSGNGKTLFGGAKFTGKKGTDFRWAKFRSVGGTSFSNARFFDEGGIDFRRTEFHSKGGTNFRYSEFSEECKVRFMGRNFYDETETDFRTLYFKNPEKVNITFDGADLNRCRFSGTDLEKINFTKVYWTGRKYDSPTYKGRIRIYDEDFQYRGRFLRKFEDDEKEKDNIFKAFFRKIGIKIVARLNASKPKEKEDNHYAVHLLYNQLIKNYEKTNRYHEAGDFFAGMMEMRRREKFEKRRFRILLWFYRLVSLYGERPFWAAGWLLFILLLFGIIYKCFGIVYPPKTSICFIKDLLNGLLISLDVMTIGRIKPLFGVKVHPIIPFIKGIQTLITAVLLSLFILAMNRKFRRTKD